MLPASAEYKAYEAQLIGATPVFRASFLPKYWPSGVNADGDFVHCAYVAPDRIQADYEGFSGGYWISPVLTANLQVSTSPAVITWGWNSPGFDSLVYYRGAADPAALAAASWTLVNNGDTIQIYPYYQFKLTLEGFRAWAVDDPGDADAFTAWAVDVAGVEAEQGYASDANVSGDVLTYIEALQLLGQFTVVRDIETAGSLSMEAPQAFDDLVAGSHSGLTLNNCQGTGEVTVLGPDEIDYSWTPAPLFSPNKPSFFLADQDWYDIQLKIELGWSKGGWFASGFLEDEWLGEGFIDFVTLFLGKVKKWGPVSRAVGSPNTVEVYAEDYIADCFKKRICLPAADGTPAPLTFGEFLCTGEAISGWSPAPVAKSAYFENNDYRELDRIVTSGGGASSLITPGIAGEASTHAFRAVTTGANQAAYGVRICPNAKTIFVTGTMRFTGVPAVTPTGHNLTFLRLMGAGGGASAFDVFVDAGGAIYSYIGALGGQDGKFNALAYVDVPLPFAFLMKADSAGIAKLWINGDEVISYAGDLSMYVPVEFWFGAGTSGTSEAWTIDFDDIEIRTQYFDNAFQVPGGPFAGIGPVYIDNLAQPETQTVGSFTQTLTRYPEYGIVQFSSTDPDFKPSGEVMFRVIEHAGGRHALYIIEALLAAAGVTEYIDAVALAAAYAAVPGDIINARFEGGQTEKQGLKDIASLGLPVADALKEITSRCLYWIFTDAGNIKIVPYTAAALVTPTDPLQILTASNKWENNQVIDLSNVNAFVTAVYGWYSRNPSLFYVAGDQTAGGQGASLDYSWDSPVACENLDMVKAKADLLLKFLGPQEQIDPVTMSLSGARFELMADVINLTDVLLSDASINYLITSKEVSLDQGGRNTALQLIRFLGE
jgi:hypothetical protein